MECLVNPDVDNGDSSFFRQMLMGTNVKVTQNIFTSAIYLSSSFLCADNLVRNENVWVNKAPSYASTFQS